MGPHHIAEQNTSSPQWNYISRVEADFTARLLMRGAGILTIGSLIAGWLLPSASSTTAQEAIAMAVLAAFGALLAFLGPRWLRTTAKVGENDILLSSAGIRALLPLYEVETVTVPISPVRVTGTGTLAKVTADSSVEGLKSTSN